MPANEAPAAAAAPADAGAHACVGRPRL